MSLGPIVVQKYGGSSVATAEKILAIAERVKTYLETHPHIVVAVSAMGKTTDQLVALARQVSRNPHGRDYDLLLASGEQVAVATLALALQDKGVPAIALTGAQCNIRTDGSFNRARIQSIDTARIVEELEKGKVVIVAGFQGVTANDDVTTLGRGGGDITGAAVAAALDAAVCEICTDVDGVLSADPNVVPDARFWPELSYEAAIEMASSGAKVLHPRAAEICMSYNIPIHIRSSFHLKEGTWIREGASSMEEAEIVGVTSDKKIAKVTLLNVPDRPGVAAEIFKDVSDKDINIRLIIQSAAADHRAGHHVHHRGRVRRRGAQAGRRVEGEGAREGRIRRQGIRDDRDHRLASRSDARAVGPDVRGAREGKDQRRLHQLVGNDDVVRHRSRRHRPRRQGRARRVLRKRAGQSS